MNESRIRKLGLRVSGKSCKTIKNYANEARKILGYEFKEYINMASLMEIFIHNDMLIILEDNDERVQQKYAYTHPDKGKIYVRDSVYNNAFDGDPRARFTIAHEIGHLIMHKEQEIFARSTCNRHKIYEDSEWQADVFAASFLINQIFVTDDMNAQEIANKFGVSLAAAESWMKYKNK